MTSNFTVQTSRSIGTTLTAIGSYTVPSSATGGATVIGLSIANTTIAPVNANVSINDGTNDTYIMKNVNLPNGSTLVIIGGEQKVVLLSGYSIKVQSSNASSIDAILSILELAN